MHLEGQYERRARPDAGYAMAVLLAGIAIMGIVWTMVVTVWKQQIQREKEAELIFRAGQYARARLNELIVQELEASSAS